MSPQFICKNAARFHMWGAPHPHRGQRITIPFQVVDPDGKDPFVIVSDWPTSTQGFLETGAWQFLVCGDIICCGTTGVGLRSVCDCPMGHTYMYVHLCACTCMHAHRLAHNHIHHCLCWRTGLTGSAKKQRRE